MRVYPLAAVLVLGLATFHPAAQAAFEPSHITLAGHHHGGFPVLLPPGAGAPAPGAGSPAPTAGTPAAGQPNPLGALPQQLLQQVFQQALAGQAAKSSQAAKQATPQAAAAPDLFATSFGASGNACELQLDHHHLAVVAHVHNQGNAAAAASHTLVTFRRVQGDQQVAVQYAMVPTPAIAAGGQAALGAVTAPPSCVASGSCSATIAVNTEQAIKESNYQNNSMACLVSPRAR
jgi:hypothetical protein